MARTRPTWGERILIVSPSLYMLEAAADAMIGPGGLDHKRFLRYYMDELKEQFRGNKKK